MIDRRRFLTGSLMLPAAAWASAQPAAAQLVNKYAEQLKNGEFNWFPERSASGPLLIIVSVPDQLVHVYRNGIRIAASTCSTGKPGHGTPTGVFKILQKDKNHRSSTYNNAPMPNMNRLTWSGIALHAGNLPGFPASHGCVRLPMAFSERLFQITKLGVTVVIADDSSHPRSVAHPGLVLGDYARNEFKAVDTSLLRSAYSEGHEAVPQANSMVVSRASSTVTVFNNDQIVAQGKVRIRNPRQPIGERAYTLNGSDAARGEVRWVSSDVRRMRKADDIDPLDRIHAEPKVRGEIRRHLQQGMTLVTTDSESNARTRSKGGFVIIDGIY